MGPFTFGDFRQRQQMPQAVCQLLVHPKTQARIMGMMSTGKPLRN